MRAMQGTCTMLGLSLSPGPWPRCSWLQCQVDQVFVFFLNVPLAMVARLQLPWYVEQKS